MLRLNGAAMPQRTRRVIGLTGVALGFWSAAAAAQVPADTTPRVVVRGAVRGTAVVLRWVPTTSRAWASGMISGYSIERAAAATPNAFQPVAAVVPWTPAQWRERVDTTNKYLMSTAELMFAAFPDGPGGRPQTPEERQADIDRRYGFGLMVADFDSVAAEAMGLRYVDATAGTATWIYRVSVRPAPEQYRPVVVPVAPGSVTIVVQPGPPLDAPPGLEIETGDGRLTLRWNPEPAGTGYVSYNIERTDATSPTPVRLNDLPLVFSLDSLNNQIPRVYIDTGLVNGRTYRYRVYGRTPFGDNSTPAEGEGTPRDLTPPSIPVVTSGIVRPAGIDLTWELQDSVPVPDLAGFLVGRGTGEDGPFRFDSTRVIPASTRTATGLSFSADSGNYFVVIARDNSGNVSFSLPYYVHVVDSTPPAAPTAVRALADTSGRVVISWARGSERDLFGYRVFRANAEDHEFTLLTGDPVTDSTFADTVVVNTLTRAIYYEVTALDLSNNASTPTRIRVTLPDVVAPVAPVVTNVSPSDSSLTLEWVPSSSADVRVHRVLRMQPTDSLWREVATLPPETRTYTDRQVVRRQSYFYSVEAEDSTGLRTMSSPVQARPYDTGVRPAVERVNAIWNDSTSTVTLSWTYPQARPGAYWFVVHRAVGDGALEAYRSVETALVFRESLTRRPAARQYRYAVQVFYQDGGVSPVSAITTVQVSPRD